MAKNEITIGERIVAGSLAALIMGVMTICVPVGIFLFATRGRGIVLLGIFGTFHIWATSLVTVAGIAGAILGADRTTILYGHLWWTEEPKMLKVTLALWTSLLLIALSSCWLFGSHHVL